MLVPQSQTTIIIGLNLKTENYMRRKLKAAADLYNAPGVNFINVKLANFSYEFFDKAKM